MPVEIQMLAWGILLGVAQLFLAAALMTRQRGLEWNASARDGDPPPLTGVAARADRAFRNFLETFPFFAAAAVAGHTITRGWDPTRTRRRTGEPVAVRGREATAVAAVPAWAWDPPVAGEAGDEGGRAEARSGC